MTLLLILLISNFCQANLQDSIVQEKINCITQSITAYPANNVVSKLGAVNSTRSGNSDISRVEKELGSPDDIYSDEDEDEDNEDSDNLDEALALLEVDESSNIETVIASYQRKRLNKNGSEYAKLQGAFAKVVKYIKNKNK